MKFLFNTALAAGQAFFSAGGAQKKHNEQTYLIMFGGDFGAWDHMQPDGSIGGFNVDLMYAVCEKAGIDCRVVVDLYKNCWTSTGSTPHGGEGLHGRWYDACIGYLHTVARDNVYGFGEPWTPVHEAQFFVDNADAASYDAADALNGKTVAFQLGWYNDAACVARNGYQLDGVKEIKAFATNKELYDNTMSGAVDVAFVERDSFLKAKDFDAAGGKFVGKPIFNCAVGGQTVMTRKDSTLQDHWNRGFDKMRVSGQLKRLGDKHAVELI